MSLESLEKTLKKDLERIQFPSQEWCAARPHGLLDVAIIGAGIAGLCLAAALYKRGIKNFGLFDERKEGKEGPWDTYARMKTLRSPKNIMGPALHIPNLTFQAWYEAQFGTEGWEKLGKIPTLQWMEYLKWFRKVLRLPIRNEAKVIKIDPQEGKFFLTLADGSKISAIKVVLATGWWGFGGPVLPDFISNIPKERYAHTNDPIDFYALKNQKVIVAGAGASAFDAAATALEHGAKTVSMLMRRTRLPSTLILPFHYGISEGFYHLPDEYKIKFFEILFESGIPPPNEAIKRVKSFPNFHIYSDYNGVLPPFDFLILGTGFEIDGTNEPLIAPHISEILLWGDRHSTRYFDKLPYLGPHFEFLPKKEAAYLKDFHCFNIAAFLSHGINDLHCVSQLAEPLARGIVSDLFRRDWDRHYQRLVKIYNVDFERPAFLCFD